MLFIRSLFSGVIFPNNEPIAVYDEQYPADCYGHKLDDNDERIASGKYYEYGNIIFHSPSMKVTFSGVYCSYNWCPEILDYIQEHLTDNMITLDLNALIKNGDDYQEFECSSISIEK